MKYRIQVYIDNEQDKGWHFIKGPSEPSGKKEYVPYEYNDHNEAYRMAKMCYPDGNFRVTDIDGNHMTTKTTMNYKNFIIDAELGDDPRVDITITKNINGEEYFGSIGAAEHEGLSNRDWTKQIQVPVAVIDKAYELENSLLNNDN